MPTRNETGLSAPENETRELPPMRMITPAGNDPPPSAKPQSRQWMTPALWTVFAIGAAIAMSLTLLALAGPEFNHYRRWERILYANLALQPPALIWPAAWQILSRPDRPAAASLLAAAPWQLTATGAVIACALLAQAAIAAFG